MYIFFAGKFKEEPGEKGFSRTILKFSRTILKFSHEKKDILYITKFVKTIDNGLAVIIIWVFPVEGARGR